MTNQERAQFNAWLQTPAGETYSRLVLRYAPLRVQIDKGPLGRAGSASRLYVGGVVGERESIDFYIDRPTED